MTSSRSAARRRVLSAVATGVLAVGGCGTAPSGAAPSPTTSPASSAGQPAAFCAGWVDSDVAGSELLRIDLTSAPLDQVRAAVREFWAEEEAILQSLVQQVPGELQPAVEALLRLARVGRASGEPATLGSPEIETADRKIDTFMLEQCPYPHVAIGASDTAYLDAPETLPATTVAITLSNSGQDVHQIILCRVDPGVTEPFAALLTARQGGGRPPITPVALVDADPGDARTVFVPLRPGRYGMFDSYPQGSTSRLDPKQSPSGARPPHFAAGMIHEFVVRE